MNRIIHKLLKHATRAKLAATIPISVDGTSRRVVDAGSNASSLAVLAVQALMGAIKVKLTTVTSSNSWGANWFQSVNNQILAIQFLCTVITVTLRLKDNCVQSTSMGRLCGFTTTMEVRIGRKAKMFTVMLPCDLKILPPYMTARLFIKLRVSV